MNNEFNNPDEIKYEGVIGEVNEQEKNNNHINNDKKLTSLNKFLIILLIIQMLSFIVWLKILTKPHSNYRNICSASFDCQDCDGKNCTCYYCEDGEIECNNPREIRCPDQKALREESLNEKK